MQCNGILVPIQRSSNDMDSDGKSQWCRGDEGNILHPPYLRLQKKQDFLLQRVATIRTHPATPLPAWGKPLCNSPY